MPSEKRVAILVSAPVSEQLRTQVAEGLTPQRDFFALADALDAELMLPFTIGGSSGTSRLSRVSRIFSSAWAAYKARDSYDLIITDLERPGLILAALFKSFGVRKRHIMVCHGKLTNVADRTLFRVLGLQRFVEMYVCYGQALANRLMESLRLPQDRVAFIKHPPDHRFWTPQPDIQTENLIVSAGLFMRDYQVLIEAMNGIDCRLEIAAYSPWVRNQSVTRMLKNASDTVKVSRNTYLGMRATYSRAIAVALPLVETPIQAGSLVLYEAMAMGKAVIATRTEGLRELDVIRDGETGIFVEPGDVSGWRDALGYLLANPAEAARMGRNARAIVEQGLNQDTFVHEFEEIIRAVIFSAPISN